jgi:hypothetical protein
MENNNPEKVINAGCSLAIVVIALFLAAVYAGCRLLT